MIRFLKWLFKGTWPDWLPPANYIDRMVQEGSPCLLDRAALPHGHRWWILVRIDLSGTRGAIEARSGPITNLSKVEPEIATADLTASDSSRFLTLFQKARAVRGRVRQPFVKDGFPANVRLSLPSGEAKFRCNLAVRAKNLDPRVELANAVFAKGSTLIDKPSLYGFCTTDGQVKLGEALRWCDEENLDESGE